jgi:hypothetical protein
MQFVPSWSLLGGLLVEHLLRRSVSENKVIAKAGGARWHYGRVGLAVVVIGLIVYGIFLVPRRIDKIRTALGEYHSPLQRVARYLHDHTASDDRIFVWGFLSEIYTHSERAPATRYSFCNFQSGLIPFVNLSPDVDTHRWIVPGSREILISELRAQQPRFIVDTSPGYYFYDKFPLRTFPALASLIDEQYELDPTATAAAEGPSGPALHVYRLVKNR